MYRYIAVARHTPRSLYPHRRATHMNRWASSLGPLLRRSSRPCQHIRSTHTGARTHAAGTTTPLSTYLFFGAPVAVTFSLGVWQTRRLSRKQHLIEERRERLFSTPLTEAQIREVEASDSELDFHAVRLRGTLLHAREMHVGPRSAPGHLPGAVTQWGGSSGLLVVTPARLADDGRLILVNRGWIPHRLADRTKRAKATVTPLPFIDDDNRPPVSEHNDSQGDDQQDSVEFLAVVRNEQERNRFMPRNDPQKGDWFYIDARSMMAAAGLLPAPDNEDADSTPAPLIVELCEPLPHNGWPFPRTLDQFLEFRTPPSTHVTYAVTWFSLSFALLLLMRARLRKIPRRL